MKKQSKVASLGAGLNFNPAMMMGGSGPPKKAVVAEASEERKSGVDEYVTGAHKRLSLRPKDRKKPDGTLFSPQEEADALDRMLDEGRSTPEVPVAEATVTKSPREKRQGEVNAGVG